MIPVGAVVRIRKDSQFYRPYRERNEGNQLGMGLLLTNQRQSWGGDYPYSVQWMNGYKNNYQRSDIEVWLGFTVEEEDQAKADGTYDELFKEYASEKSIELARANGQYIPGMVITDGGEENGGSGSGEVQTGLDAGGYLGEVGGVWDDFQRPRSYWGGQNPDSPIGSGIYSQIRSVEQGHRHSPDPLTTESMERIIRQLYQSSSFGYQFDSSPRPTVRDRPVDLGRVSPISVGTIHHRRR